MKKFIASSVAAATLLFGQSAFADDTVAELQKQLQEMQNQLRQQQEQLNRLQNQAGQEFVTRDEARRLIENEMAVLVDERVEQSMAQVRDSSPILTLGPNIDGLDIRGSASFRWVRRVHDSSWGDVDFNGTGYEYDPLGPEGDNKSSEDSFEATLALGGVWRSEGWEIGLGLTLASDSATTDVGGEAANNGNVFDSYNSDAVFESMDIYLDYLYAKHTWGDLSLTIGQMINPFRTSWLLWDPDMRPTGIVSQYTYQDFFLTIGGFSVRQFGVDEANGYMMAIQGGYAATYEQLDVVAAAAWYYTNENVTAYNNNTNPVEGLSGGLGDDYKYSLLDLYLDLTWNTGNDLSFGLTGQFVYNFGAEGDSFNSQIGTLLDSEEPEDNNIAWLVGGDVTWQAWTLAYAYAHIQSDSLPGTWSDNEFGSTLGVGYGSVNTEGHKISLGYAFNENITLTGTAFYVETVEDYVRSGDGYDDEGQRYQLDLTYIF